MKSSNVMKIRVGVGSGLVAILLIALFGTQVYIKRGVQGRLKSAADDIGEQYTATPYYSSSAIKMASVALPYTSSKYATSDQAAVVADSIQQFNTEEYARVYEHDFLFVKDNPLSTFSIDVDTASYSNIRRFLEQGQIPPVDAVRIEEMINYFSYNYKKPIGEVPFAVSIDGAVAPWNKTHQLLRIGLQGKTLSQTEMPASNLVFLIDVSGSMQDANKLPLLKESLKLMVAQLSDKQRVAMVVYAGAAGQVLESTSGSDKRKILSAIDRLSAGGSTAGGAGIQLAYKIAMQNYIKGGNNRVILATDGDFNVGVSSTSEMTRLIEEKRKDNIFITVLGFGMGNYKDNRLEQIADKGNGTYYYIDTLKEAKKVLIEELGSTLFTIAKDVKLQVEFNPAQVKAYRLIGYENRVLNKEDFNNDAKDAGELGAGHTVTALYEIVPVDSTEQFAKVDELTYQKSQNIPSEDLATVKLRYKEPDQDISQLIQQSISRANIVQELTDDFQFAAAVVEFGLLLKDSQYKANSSYEHVIESAIKSRGADRFGYRLEFIDLVKKAQSLDNRPKVNVDRDEGQPTSSGIKYKSSDDR
ncbi:MAG: VWA domain-containing protein [Candidatus Omnitrophica bacterium]|nr:VWA domain-containing protein [Candidatus Omnitrophota bacterium]